MEEVVVLLGFEPVLASSGFGGHFLGASDASHDALRGTHGLSLGGLLVEDITELVDHRRGAG